VARVLRGCGARVEGGLYLTAASSPFGCSVECFLYDPPIPWKGPKVLRAPLLHRDKRGIYHVVMSVGKKFYPSPVDFIEEVRRLGLSKRVPADFDFTKLTPGLSKIILVHPRAIPLFEFKAEYDCPRKRCWCGLGRIPASMAHPHRDGDPRCIGALWPLRAIIENPPQYRLLPAGFEAPTPPDYIGVAKELFDEDGSLKVDEVFVETPWGGYRVRVPEKPRKPGEYSWGAGIFAAFPLGRVEYVSRKGRLPESIAERAKRWASEKGGEVVVVEE